MNTELLLKIKAHILEEPERLDMNIVLRLEPKNACGSAGCIDGWAQILSRATPLKTIVPYDPDYAIGRKLLDLTEEEAVKLFTAPPDEFNEDELLDEGWPVEFADRYSLAKSAKARAQITADRIDHFIDTKGKD